MTGQQIDRRIARTRRMIRDALTKLIEEKGFDAITVSDLTERADINRGTFYLHYRDKYDLLRQSEEEILADIEAISEMSMEQLNDDSPVQYEKMEKQIPFLVHLLVYLGSNSDFMKVILGPRGDLSFHIKLKDIMSRHLILKLKEWQSGESSVPIEYIAAYLISADFGIVQLWLENGMKESAKELAVIMNNITFQGPARAAGYRPPNHPRDM
ncbi:TetR/AcrR family transcriptional regulator [Sporolactobacillus sp. KGMB 08714]|uniref:TetR/AcrR family transcriptional regulator n=1 Tax=Sporolactobacillus sp. KGMB 08714 TaxID=3064704 RepID=UPI002FBD43D6